MGVWDGIGVKVGVLVSERLVAVRVGIGALVFSMIWPVLQADRNRHASKRTEVKVFLFFIIYS
jgi:hypothetical protein